MHTGVSSAEQLRSLQNAAAALKQNAEETAEERKEEPVAAVRHLLMHFTEDIIADMAGFVPLSAIGERVLEEFGADRFGDFRGTLLGLLAAYNYELSILLARFLFSFVDFSRFMGGLGGLLCALSSLSSFPLSPNVLNCFQ